MNHAHIHPTDLINSTAGSSCIVDVRTTAEVQAESIPDAIHIPLHELTAARLQGELSKRAAPVATLYLVCQAGRRAELAADQLYGHISQTLYVVDGGINALKNTGFPLQGSGKNVMALERQVRIAAGFLVFTGVMMGTWIHPGFYGLSGFVGAGLMFAGITDTCLMGMLLARMPWNT